MTRSRVFVSLAIALFLADCLSAAAANVPANNKDEKTATQRVNALKALTARVLGNAEKKFGEAESTKLTVESQKRKADSAELAVRTAAESITVKKRKDEALVIAQKAVEELGKCNKLYEDAKDKAATASNSLNTFVSSARDLDNKAKIDISPDTGKADEYTTVIASATEFSSQTTTLSQQIDQSPVLGTARAALFELQTGAQKVQVLKYQAESLVIVSKIETKMSEAKTNIQSIKEKKEEIDIIVEGMNTKLKSASGTSTSVLSSLCITAESQLRTATNKVAEVNKYNEEMVKHKTQLDKDLKTLMARTDEETNAATEARTVVWHEGLINGEIEKIKQALRAAENAFNSAKIVQKQMQDTMDKTSNPPVNAHLDKTAQNKSSPLTDKEKPNPTDNNSELFNNDKLRNMTKEITNNSLIGGEVPTRSAANDSAVTVFIPLLVIVVMSAVLH